MRRPLRFLASKLELDADQITRLATILSDLKTERAQADVDQRRRVAILADALEAGTLDAARFEEAAAAQSRTCERLAAAVTRALTQIHALLSEPQRKKFAYYLRTGVLAV